VFDGQVDGDRGPVAVRRSRRVTATGAVERIELRATGPVALDLVLRVASDLAPTPVVKAGAAPPPLTPTPTPDGAAWERDGTRTEVGTDPAPASTAVEGTDAVLTWPVRLPAGGTWTLALELRADVRTGFRSAAPLPRPVQPDLPDARLAALRRRSLADLDGLLLADPDHPDDRFAAAGSPWFCTLFGRDALWTARLLLPLGPALAGGTLRVLARRQGRRDDPDAEEEPGRILHEVRPARLQAGGLDLPPVYYGTIDATPLWCCLLHDAWRAGLPDPEVAALLPHLEAALAWIRRAAAPTGFLAYAGSGGGGLANQGWKDSPDGVRWADGTVAARPLALCEVQGYAHEAALGGAALLDAFGRPGPAEHRRWAADLAGRFRRAFWVDDPAGPHPAIALDGAGRPVTGGRLERGPPAPDGAARRRRGAAGRRAPRPPRPGLRPRAAHPRAATSGVVRGAALPPWDGVAATTPRSPRWDSPPPGTAPPSRARWRRGWSPPRPTSRPAARALRRGRREPVLPYRPRAARRRGGSGRRCGADLPQRGPLPRCRRRGTRMTAPRPAGRRPPRRRERASRTSSTAPSRVAESPSLVVTSRRLRVARGRERW
jgi:hypothetical protein